MTRRSVSLSILGLAVLLLLILAPDVLLTIFAGILFAVFLRGGGCWIAKRLSIGDGWGIGLFLTAIIALFAISGTIAAPSVVEQFEDLTSQLPEALGAVQDRIERYSWGERLMNQIRPEGLWSSGGDAATRAVSTTFGALGTFVIILFIGLYGAIDPGLYRQGVRLLMAPSLRNEATRVMDATGQTLRNWLMAQLIAMAVVGVLTGLGLWAIGIPLAFILGLIAALLAFIPNIGPVIAAAPAVLLAFSTGRNEVLLVLAVYIGVQTLESYVITPLIQQERVSLAPAFVIAVQLMFGVLFGLMGLALSTPIAAAMITIVQMTYIKRYLDAEPAVEQTLALSTK